LTAFLAALLWDYTRKKKYYCGFMTLFDGLDDKTLLAELVEKLGFLDGKLLYQILRLSNNWTERRPRLLYAPVLS
jgi:hypothetical protein